MITLEDAARHLIAAIALQAQLQPPASLSGVPDQISSIPSISGMPMSVISTSGGASGSIRVLIC